MSGSLLKYYLFKNKKCPVYLMIKLQDQEKKCVSRVMDEGRC